MEIEEKLLDEIKKKINELVKIHDKILEENKDLGEKEKFTMKACFLGASIDQMLRKTTEDPAEGMAYLKVIEKLFKEEYGIRETSPKPKSIYG